MIKVRNCIFIIGGSFQVSCEIFNANSKELVLAKDHPTSSLQQVGLSQNHFTKLYTFGGKILDDITDEISEYDVASNKWKEILAKLPKKTTPVAYGGLQEHSLVFDN